MLDVDLKVLKEELRDKLDWTVDGGADEEDFAPHDSDDSLDSWNAGMGRRGGDNGLSSNNDGDRLGSCGDAQSAEGNQDPSEFQDGEDETRACDNTGQPNAEEEPSGFLHGVNGSSPIYTNGKFWNYVDDSLDRLRKRARKEAGDHGREFELELYSRYGLI